MKCGRTWYYGNNLARQGGIGAEYQDEPPSYQVTVYDRDAVTPDWAKRAVTYQIFPDRFYRGESATAQLTGKHGAVLHSCWDDAPCYCKDAHGNVVQYDFFGGNLAGITAKLPYQSQDLPYYAWYKFNKYPDDYKSWWGIKVLPEVEETTPSYLDFIIHSKDSVLKYWLRQGISGWRMDVAAYGQLCENYPPQNLAAMLNILGSHDVPRLLTVLGGQVTENVALQRVQLAALWQFCRGFPASTTGMRQGFRAVRIRITGVLIPGGRKNIQLREWYRQLAWVRREHPALATGRYVPLLARGEVLVYARVNEGGADQFGQASPDEVLLAVTPKAMRQDPTGVTIESGVRSSKRRAGLLLHPSSLLAAFPDGPLGLLTRNWLDFLAAAGQKLWPILSLTPPGLGTSPYMSNSAFAGNTELLSLAALRQRRRLGGSICARRCATAALKAWRGKMAWKIYLEITLQFCFFTEWQDLHAYAR